MVAELAPCEVARRRAAGEPLVILDVREGWELAVSALEDVVHIPMAEVAARLGELDPGRMTVVLCRSGVRSRQVATWLLARGFSSVANLTGGILAWHEDVDPSVPAY